MLLDTLLNSNDTCNFDLKAIDYISAISPGEQAYRMFNLCHKVLVDKCEIDISKEYLKLLVENANCGREMKLFILNVFTLVLCSIIIIANSILLFALIKEDSVCFHCNLFSFLLF